MRFSTPVRFIAVAGFVLFALQQAIAVRALRFPEEEILFWLLVLAVAVTGAFFYFLYRTIRMRFILELAAFIIALEGLWILSRWVFSPLTSFIVVAVSVILLLYGNGKLKLPIYALGTAASALVYTFLLAPIHLFPLFGGLLIYDTLMFREGLRFPHDGSLWSLLRLQTEALFPLSYHVITLIFLSQLSYLHPVIGIVTWLLVLIALSQVSTHMRRNVSLLALGLLLPYSFALSLYHYAT